MIEEAVKEFKSMAVKAIHAGVPIPGYRAGWTSPRRVWADPHKADKLLANLGLTTDERFTVELLSPAQAEKALRAKGVIGRKARGKPAPANPLEPLVAYGEANPAIERADPAPDAGA